MAADPDRGLILQHGEDGPPGILAEWLGERGIAFEVHPTWREPLPRSPGRFAWIASLGSEHTPGSPDAPAWVDAELDFLHQAVEAQVPVLGLCFGGQALAVAAGGAVGPAEPPEIAWMELDSEDPELIPAGPWLHYHYDQLEPPPRARVLARSAAGPAAFQLDASLGLQFHPESTPAIAADWARQDAARLAATDLDPGELEAQGRRAAPAAARAARRLFDAWWERMGKSSTGAAGTRSRPERRSE